MQVEIITVSGPERHVHAAGCRDLSQRRYRGLDRGWIIEVETRADVVREVYPPDNFDYDPDEWEIFADEFTWFGCALLRRYEEV